MWGALRWRDVGTCPHLSFCSRGWGEAPRQEAEQGSMRAGVAVRTGGSAPPLAQAHPVLCSQVCARLYRYEPPQCSQQACEAALTPLADGRAKNRGVKQLTTGHTAQGPRLEFESGLLTQQSMFLNSMWGGPRSSHLFNGITDTYRAE